MMTVMQSLMCAVSSLPRKNVCELTDQYKSSLLAIAFPYAQLKASETQADSNQSYDELFDELDAVNAKSANKNVEASHANGANASNPPDVV